MTRATEQNLRPRFHKLALGTWALLVIAQAVVLTAWQQTIDPPIFGWVGAAISVVAVMSLVWGSIERRLDRSVARGGLQAGRTRLAVSLIATVFVAAPPSLAYLVYFESPVVPVAVTTLVYVPWMLLLAWLLGPRRSAAIRRRTNEPK